MVGRWHLNWDFKENEAVATQAGVGLTSYSLTFLSLCLSVCKSG